MSSLPLFMRAARLLAPWKDDVDGKPAIYHCVSRVVGRQFLFKKAEKEQFVHFMRLYSRFCGVRILSHCVMSNHFHLQVEVPPGEGSRITDAEFFRRLSVLYSEGKVGQVKKELDEARQEDDEERVAEIKERYTYRMGDLSEFMKTLKQRFTQWFNKKHGRKGTLWEERFQSVLVEDGYTARVMSAYIDLNPVRAGIEQDPKDYRWSSYASALAGDEEALAGLARVMGEFEECATGVRRGQSVPKMLAAYRVILFEDGEESLREEGDGELKIARKGMSAKAVEKVRESGGVLGRSQLLRHRVETFVSGGILGSQGFVDEVFTQAKEVLASRRTKGAREVKGSAVPLCALRA